MNMAMSERTQLPTPYPVALNGVGDWTDWMYPGYLTKPIESLAYWLTPIPQTVGITPQTKAAYAKQYVASGMAVDPTASSSAQKAQSAMSDGNWGAAANIISNYTHYKQGKFDQSQNTMDISGGDGAGGSSRDRLTSAVMIGATIIGGAILIKFVFGGK